MSDPSVLPPEKVTLRRATIDDVGSVLGMMDTAISWLTAQDRTGQWGDDKQSVRDNPDRVKHITEYLCMPGAWVAVSTTADPADSTVIGAVTVDPTSPEYVPAADAPEMYVRLLITDRAWKGRRIGNCLVAKARDLAKAAGVDVLRVDCYAGGDGKLVKWYESAGFEKAQTFTAKGTWPGQILFMRLDGAKGEQ